MDYITVCNEDEDYLSLEVRGNKLFCPQCEEELDGGDPTHICVTENGELMEYSPVSDDAVGKDGRSIEIERQVYSSKR